MRTQPSRKVPKKTRRKCQFIDDEAGVSGDESSDELDNDFVTQLDRTADVDEGDPDVDMHAKYLQSIRYATSRTRFVHLDVIDLSLLH